MNQKIALVSDPHFGIKKSNKTFLENQLKFFYEEFIPYLRRNQIKEVVFLGDLFDNRNSINTYMKKEVFNLFEEMKEFTIHIFPGNHDIYFRTTTDVHSLTFLKKFDNVHLVEEIELRKIFGKKMLFVPWQVDLKDFAKRVANKNIHCDICFGHFEIIGFQFNNVKVCEVGLENKIFFNNYTLTFSGHFHKMASVKRNGTEIVYVGSPYQLTRNDKGDQRGFFVLDVKSMTYEFVESTKTLKFIDLKYPETFTKEMIENNVIDCYVDYDVETTKDDDIQNYIREVEKMNPAYPPNVFLHHNLFEIDQKEYNAKSISELINEYINDLKINNKDEVYEFISELYTRAKGSDV